MSLTAEEQRRLDFLWKTRFWKGMTSPLKHLFEEWIADVNLQVTTDDVWSEAGLINIPAPGSTSGVVEYYSDLTLTADYTVPDNKVFIAASTPGDVSTRLDKWIPPRFHYTYNVQLYQDDGGGSKGTQIHTRDPLEWIFFDFGVVVCLQDPSALGYTLPLHLSGYRYVGATGLGSGTGDLNTTWSPPGAQATWNINHNLGKYPSVQVVGPSGPVTYDTITYVDTDNLTLTFTDPVDGTAYLN